MSLTVICITEKFAGQLHEYDWVRSLSPGAAPPHSPHDHTQKSSSRFPSSLLPLLRCPVSCRLEIHRPGQTGEDEGNRKTLIKSTPINVILILPDRMFLQLQKDRFMNESSVIAFYLLYVMQIKDFINCGPWNYTVSDKKDKVKINICFKTYVSEYPRSDQMVHWLHISCPGWSSAVLAHIRWVVGKSEICSVTRLVVRHMHMLSVQYYDRHEV